MNNNYSIQLGRETFAFNTGYLAKQADGAVLVSSGENMVFASVVAAKDLVEGQDYFPLMVDYREKLYAAGLFPGGFIK
nr:polyribonucleotide nucleotidyltransferase [Spirochaetota bacterium]